MLLPCSCEVINSPSGVVHFIVIPIDSLMLFRTYMEYQGIEVCFSADAVFMLVRFLRKYVNLAAGHQNSPVVETLKLLSSDEARE